MSAIPDLPTDAACAGADLTWWQPPHGTPELDAHRNTRHAKQICLRSCPTLTRVACLRYALTHDVDGIWGGTDPAERDLLRTFTPARSAAS
jgi:hypothetical protein